MTIILLVFFAFLAGFIDAIVGGGGLIQLPAILILMPQWPQALALGTNKAASVAGTFVAFLKYIRSIKISFKTTIVGMILAFLGAALGAKVVTLIDPHFFKSFIIVLLILVFIYSLKQKNLGAEHQPKYWGYKEIILIAFVSLVLGFYDGFFGPGTGTFLIFIYIGLFGYGFLYASTYAKAVNLATNIGALAFFISHGDVDFTVAIPMAIAQMFGAYTGARLAILKGSAFVRRLFIIIVGLLITKLLTAYF